MQRSLVVKLTAGAQEPERANQAFTASAAGCASGVPVSLWLTGDATWFGVTGHAESFDLPLATPLADLRDAVMAAGALTVCTQCAARREITERDLIPGVRLAGAATFVEEILAKGAQALVY